jgi:hypothetical protein
MNELVKNCQAANDVTYHYTKAAFSAREPCWHWMIEAVSSELIICKSRICKTKRSLQVCQRLLTFNPTRPPAEMMKERFHLFLFFLHPRTFITVRLTTCFCTSLSPFFPIKALLHYLVVLKKSLEINHMDFSDE